MHCIQVNRREAGKLLIPDLLNQYLFPASKLIAEGLKRASFLSTPTNINPKCSQSESRLAAYALIIELVFECKENLEAVVKQLISMHHRFNPDLAKEFEVCHQSTILDQANNVFEFLVWTSCWRSSCLQLRRFEKCWSNLLYELGYPATIPDTRNKRILIGDRGRRFWWRYAVFPVSNGHGTLTGNCCHMFNMLLV